MLSQNPVVFIPGITASQLHDRYEIDPRRVWSAVCRSYARVALHPDDLRFERIEPARVVPEQVFAIPYREFIADLRHDLSPGVDRPTPVYPFEYDWRQPLDVTETRLADFVAEVIDRTKLLPHYTDAWRADPRVDLVGHSMGGLIAAGYLERSGVNARVGKVVSIGAPFRGSFEAALKVTTGLANLGDDAQSAAEREAARMTPALYHLLPEFEDALEVDPGLPASLFDPGLWQPGVVATLAEFIRSYSIRNDDPAIAARRLFSELLTAAKRHRDRIGRLRLAGAGLQNSDWLCIVGVDARTRVRLRVEAAQDGPRYDLRSAYRQNRYDDADPSVRHLTGDGTVPYLGALPAFLPRRCVVCVRPSDFGYWREAVDKALLRVVGFHGILPRMNLINNLAAAFLSGKPRKGTWAWPPPGLAPDERWEPPLALAERRRVDSAN